MSLRTVLAIDSTRAASPPARLLPDVQEDILEADTEMARVVVTDTEMARVVVTGRPLHASAGRLQPEP